MSKNTKYPCVHMERYANFKCKKHTNLFDCPDVVIIYEPKFDEYGIPVKDGGSSYITINFCPHCGVKLPESKRNKWFDELEKLGFDDPMGREDLPKEYLTDGWYRRQYKL